jgi:hypothetical protein
MLDDFLTLLKIIFLGKAILLTPTPVSIDQVYLIELEKPVSIVTSGAHLVIQTSETRKKKVDIVNGKNWLEAVDDLKLTYPKGSITAKLYSADEKSFALMETLPGVDKNFTPTIWVASSHDSPSLPEGVKISKIEIFTKVPLKDVEIQWVNYSE